MGLLKLLSFSPSDEEQKYQNEQIAIEIAEKLTSLIEKFEEEYKEGIPIINESLTDLSKKDKELTLAIIEVLKDKHGDIHKNFPFKINS